LGFGVWGLGLELKVETGDQDKRFRVRVQGWLRIVWGLGLRILEFLGFKLRAQDIGFRV